MADVIQNELLRQILGLNNSAPDLPSPLMSPQDTVAMQMAPSPLNPAPVKTAVTQANPAMSKFAVTSTMQSPADRAMAADMNNRFKELMLQQDAGIAKQDQAIQDYKNSKRIDLTGAGLLADSVFGGNMTPAVQKWSGEQDAERAKVIQDMEGSLNQQRASQSNQIKALIDSKNSMKIAEMADKNARFQQGQAMRLNGQFNTEVNNVTKPFFEASQSAKSVQDALTPDANGMLNAQRVKMALSQASRLMGEKGVLTDEDIKRVWARTLEGDTAGFVKYVTSAPDDVQIPAHMAEPLRQAIASGMNALGQTANQRVQLAKNKYVGFYGLDENVGTGVANLLGNELVPQAPGNPPATPPSAKPPPGMTREQFKAWKASQGKK